MIFWSCIQHVDFLFDPRLLGLIRAGKRENAVAALASKALALSRSEVVSIDVISVAARTMNSSHGNTTNSGRITKARYFKALAQNF